MVQWRSDNFEWKKIRFSLKTQRSYAVPKKRTQHMTHFPLQRRRSLRLRLRVASPAIVDAHRYCLYSSSTFQKKKQVGSRTNLHARRVMKTNLHFVYEAGQPSPHFAGLSGMDLCRAGRPALPPLNAS